jgi:hypothetical protein
MERDRDLDGIPDWQEDENYADETPVRGPYRPGRAAGGCALPLAVLLAAAGALARVAAGRRRR